MPSPILTLDHLQIGAPPDSGSAARRFYGEILGLPELPVPAALRDRASAWFRCGPIEIHIARIPGYVPQERAHPAFLVNDLDAMKSALVANGHPVLDNLERPEVRRFFSRDPWGNRLEFIQRPEAAPVSA